MSQERIPPYFYNYYNYDTVTYKIVRLYGIWSNNSGNLSVTVNNTPVAGSSWKYVGSNFKVFVELNTSSTSSSNNIVLTDNNGGTKQITIFYDSPQVSINNPIVKLFLYDAYDGTGVCDAPPYRTDNTLQDNIKRLQLEGLLLQSFFAETYRGSIQQQEGLLGLPYTTFPLEMDSSGNPIVRHVKSTNPTYKRDYFTPSVGGSLGVGEALATVSDAPYSGRKLFTFSYTLTSHINTTTGLYGGGVAHGGEGNGVMNAANLIWHPTSINNIQSVFDNYSNLTNNPYNQIDNAATISASYARIMGSVMHEMCHLFISSDHPDEIIALANKVSNSNGINLYGSMHYANPLNYTFSFDIEKYPIAFGIDMDDATYIRDWFMPYYTTSVIPYSNSEYGPSKLGWFSPFIINGYCGLTDTISKNTCPLKYKELFNCNVSLPASDKFWLTSGSKIGFKNFDLLQPHPSFTSFTTLNNAGYYDITPPTDVSYMLVNLWGSYGATVPQSFQSINDTGGAGGYIRIGFPVFSNDKIKILIGDTKSFGSGGIAAGGSGGPYGGNGGGKSAIFLNNKLIGCAGGGGGGLNLGPGSPSDEIIKSYKYNGDSAIYPSGIGENSYLRPFGIDGIIQAGCGGGGYFGGESSKYFKSWNSGGAGSSYVDSNICVSIIMKGGIPGYSNRYSAGVSRILPDIKYNYNYYINNLRGSCVYRFINVSSAHIIRCNYDLQSINTSINVISNDLMPTSNITTIPHVNIWENSNNFITISQNSTKIICSNNVTGYLPNTNFGYNSNNIVEMLSNHAIALKKDILYTTGITTLSSGATDTTILLQLDTVDSTLQDTENKYYKYTVSIQSNYPQITVRSASIQGMSHGTITIIHQLRNNAYLSTRIGTGYISDFSSCSYSGMLIDPARDPLEYNYMTELLDLCRFYKLRFLHIHGTDDQGFRFPIDCNITKFTNTNIISGVTSNYTLNLLNTSNMYINPDLRWYSSHESWSNFVLYGESRGVTIVPEFELIGHFGAVSRAYPDIFGSNGGEMNSGREVCYIAVSKIIDQLSITFPYSEYIHIGTDEATHVDADLIKSANDCGLLQLHPNNLPTPLTGDSIRDFFIYRVNNYIRSKGKKTITWENRNHSNTYISTSNTIITQSWLINGGAGPEDIYPEQIHGSALAIIKNGSVNPPPLNIGTAAFQSPWQPRLTSKGRGMFDWTPNGIISETSERIITSSNNLGSIVLLWENDPHIHKYLLLKNQCGIRSQGTNSMTKQSISFNTFTNNIDYLYKKIDCLISGFYIVETGAINTYGSNLRRYADTTSLGPIITFSENIIITVIKYVNTISVRYIIDDSFAYDKAFTFANSKLYTDNIIFNISSPEITNGYICIHFQSFIGEIPSGRVFIKYYKFEPYNILVTGCISSPYIAKTILRQFENTYYFEDVGHVILNAIHIPNHTIRYAFGRNITNKSTAILVNQQISILSSSEILHIAIFNELNILVGNIWSAQFIKLDTPNNILDIIISLRDPVNLSKNQHIVPSSKTTFSITEIYTTNAVIRISDLLNNYGISYKGVVITAIVIGGGGDNTNGGMTTDVYYNITSAFTLVINVGGVYQESSLFIRRSWLSLINDTSTSKAIDSPYYPIIAYPGNNLTNGTVTKGDELVLPNGYLYNGISYGYQGNAGIIILKIESIFNP